MLHFRFWKFFLWVTSNLNLVGEKTKIHRMVTGPQSSDRFMVKLILDSAPLSFWVIAYPNQSFGFSRFCLLPLTNVFLPTPKQSWILLECTVELSCFKPAACIGGPENPFKCLGELQGGTRLRSHGAVVWWQPGEGVGLVCLSFWEKVQGVWGILKV